MLHKQYCLGASVICLVTSQSLRGKFFTEYLDEYCDIEILDPMMFIGLYNK